MKSGGMRWLGLSALGAIAACGTAPPGASEGGPEQVGSVSAALDTSCSVTIDNLGWWSPDTGLFQIYGYATGTCADGASLEYRFTLTDPKNKATVGAWGPQPSPSFAPVSGPEGTDTLLVEVRRPGASDVAAKASKKLLVGRGCTSVGMTTMPSDTAPSGAQVTVQPYLACSSLPYEWRLAVKRPGGGSVSYPWQTAPSLVWDTTGVNAGVATLTVSARNVGNTVVDATDSLSFTVGSVCNAATLTASGAGLTRTLSATASCVNSGTPVYRYSMTAPNGTASLLRDYAAEPSFDWDVTDLDGSYTAKVEVRAEQSPEQIATAKTLKVNVGSPCTSVTLPDTWGRYVRSQGLSVTASAPCTNAEYQFQRRVPNNSSWTTVCPYSSSATCDLRIAEQPVGDYVVRAQVRKAGSIAAQDAASSQRELIVTDGIPLLRHFFTDYTLGATGVSSDGRYVLTSSGRWSRSGGVAVLDRPDDAAFGYQPGGFVDMNDSGSVLVGWDVYSDYREGATRWTASTTNWLATPQEYYRQSHASATNANGSVVVGFVSVDGGQEAFRWTSAGIVKLGDLPGGYDYSDARDVSGDGKIVVGTGWANDHNEGYRWTSTTGMVALGLLPGDTWSSAEHISRDGKVIVGQGGPGNHPLQWTATSGWTALPLPSGTSGGFPVAVSADGSTTFGNCFIEGGGAQPCVWTAAGVRLLEDILTEQGVDLTGWNLQSAVAMSADAKTFVGVDDYYFGWIVTMP